MGIPRPPLYSLTLLRLGICYLQIELGRLAQPLLLHNGPLQVRNGDVQPIEGDGVKVQGTLKLVVHRHDGHTLCVSCFCRPSPTVIHWKDYFGEICQETVL